MPEIPKNWKTASQGFQALEDGTYQCVVREAAVKPTKDHTSYNVEIQWEVRIDSPENEISVIGKKFRQWINFSEGALWNSKPMLEDLTGEDFENLIEEDHREQLQFIPGMVLNYIQGVVADVTVEKVPDVRDIDKAQQENREPNTVNNVLQIKRTDNQVWNNSY